METFMQYNKANIEAAADHVRNYHEIDVIYNATDILVIADESTGINAFEAQLAASTLEWDGEDCNGRLLLENLVNIQGVRTSFGKRQTTDEWQARYAIVVK